MATQASSTTAKDGAASASTSTRKNHADAARAESDPVILKLPHPYLTAYQIRPTTSSSTSQSQGQSRSVRTYQILHVPEQDGAGGTEPPVQLENNAVSFTDIALLSADQVPKDGDNSSWARARRAPYSTISWNSSSAPSVAQLWLVSYALITLHPLIESIRVTLNGSGASSLVSELYRTGLFGSHPVPSTASHPTDGHILFRGTFWQGAGSPFGPRPVWSPHLSSSNKPITTFYPAFPHQMAPTTVFPALPRHTSHPVRESKPEPGSIIYSRWIPHLKEHFTMIALDYQDPKHLELFHNWQNDPRVAAGWNETGDLEHHRNYLKNLHEDPHVLTMFAAFNDKPFAYFEVYWALEDHMGAHYLAEHHDRGRHSLVGDVSFRGPYRVSAWWSGLMHYMFLDEPRTMRVVGEPKATNSTVLAYDFAHGFHVEKLIDLPHKRSALMMVSREKFFQLSPLVWDGEKVVRPSLDALAKL
ncbi:aerobactin siderophore biosynthesis protein iucB [Lophiotrema nucula]|uniref:Aerobactin siderophore biosynthesis protein iucB n=1 Tax=Lophiotrema nucula TaxID=690887 RepID=A0A6A5YUQ6_9PLEO|nr:aerobactin siderophore biosynthesis protein iucB [Lophiotrema nucula]